MAATFPHVGGDGTRMTVLEVDEDDRDRLGAVITAAGLPTGRPVAVVVGGAGGMHDSDLHRLRPTFDGIVGMLDELGAAAVDGGTDAGVMRLLGQARHDAGAGFPLVGVAARGTVIVADRPHGPGAADPAPGHSHLVLVPGDDWGDESPWLGRVATALAGTADGESTAGSATLLVNGGAIAYADARHSHTHGREVVVVAGSGRTADELAAALRDDPTADSRARALVAGGPVTSVPVDRPDTIVAALRSRLQPTAR